jgi:hypothetical protein
VNERVAINAVSLTECPGVDCSLITSYLFLGNERLQVDDHSSMYFEPKDDLGFTFDRTLLLGFRILFSPGKSS